MARTRRQLKRVARYSLMRAGRLMGPEPHRLLRSMHSYLELGAWTRAIGARLPTPVDTRVELFELALGHVTGTRVLYLEFGVFRGESLRWWLTHLVDEHARFVGFDSFEGLPEHWNASHGKGHFGVGRAPVIDDDRASIQEGWFQDTLPSFTVPEHDQLIVNVDCDIYSSSIFVLRQLRAHLVPGTLLYFDELNDRDHELRALREFLTETGRASRFSARPGAA
jgi:hypothetical protein